MEVGGIKNSEVSYEVIVRVQVRNDEIFKQGSSSVFVDKIKNLGGRIKGI